MIKLDSGIIEQVLYNIINNAILYTPSNAVISIDASYTNEKCIISIIDNGNGFPEKEIPFVFDKFYRLKSSKTGGLGLGLSIAKGFIEAHQGQIILENNKISGAKFQIILPTEISNFNTLKHE